MDGAFERAFAVVLGHEGGYTADPTDPGNWTGGAPGRGECRGTNWGISAASYPYLPIRALTREQACDVYRRDYWAKVRGDELPPAVALLVFDAAVNSGTSRSARWLQQALGVPDDGALGPRTLAAVTHRVRRAPSRDVASSGEPLGSTGRGVVPRGTPDEAPFSPGEQELCAELLAVRLTFMTGLPTWPRFGRGWTRRIAHLALQAAAMGPALRGEAA